MNDEESKNKLKMIDIIDELANLKKYNNDLFNNVKGEKLENYLNELNESITNAQNKAEVIFTDHFE